MKNSIEYIKGDATQPWGDGNKIICHVCNDIGMWGKGFVLAVSKRWTQPEAEYRKWFAAGKDAGFSLGSVQFVQVEPVVWVANMIGQHKIKNTTIGPPIRYDALAACLMKVADKARELTATIHMPRIGCGLAGGKWAKIEPLIQDCLCDSGIQVIVYDFD